MPKMISQPADMYSNQEVANILSAMRFGRSNIGFCDLGCASSEAKSSQVITEQNLSADLVHILVNYHGEKQNLQTLTEQLKKARILAPHKKQTFVISLLDVKDIHFSNIIVNTDGEVLIVNSMMGSEKAEHAFLKAIHKAIRIKQNNPLTVKPDNQYSELKQKDNVSCGPIAACIAGMITSRSSLHEQTETIQKTLKEIVQAPAALRAQQTELVAAMDNAYDLSTLPDLQQIQTQTEAVKTYPQALACADHARKAYARVYPLSNDAFQAEPAQAMMQLIASLKQLSTFLSLVGLGINIDTIEQIKFNYYSRKIAEQNHIHVMHAYVAENSDQARKFHDCYIQLLENKNAKGLIEFLNENKTLYQLLENNIQLMANIQLDWAKHLASIDTLETVKHQASNSEKQRVKKEVPKKEQESKQTSKYDKALGNNAKPEKQKRKVFASKLKLPKVKKRLYIDSVQKSLAKYVKSIDIIKSQADENKAIEKTINLTTAEKKSLKIEVTLEALKTTGENCHPTAYAAMATYFQLAYQEKKEAMPIVIFEAKIPYCAEQMAHELLQRDLIPSWKTHNMKSLYAILSQSDQNKLLSLLNDNKQYLSESLREKYDKMLDSLNPPAVRQQRP